jgi:hypothetical protein
MMGRLLALFLLAASAPAAQDRADLPQSVETWYRVLQGKRQAGYIHESMAWAGVSWRYQYGQEGELELTLRGEGYQEDWSASALLDETLAPAELAFEAYANDSLSTLSLFSTRDERRIEAKPASAKEPIVWSVSTRDEIHVLPTVSLYGLRQGEVLARPGRHTLRVLDPRGEAKDGIEVVLEVGPAARRPVLGAEVPGTPITFLKPFPSGRAETGLRDAFVDRYGRILEATLVGGARIVMAANRSQALAELGPVHRHGRRDPMDKLAAMKNAALERRRALTGEPDPGAPPPTLDSLSSDLVGVQKLLEQVRAQKADGEADEARRSYLKALVRLKAIRDLAQKRRPEILPDIEKLRDDAELAWDGAARVTEEARTLYVRIEDQVARLDCEGVERTHADLQALRDRIEVERRPEREAIAAMAADVGTLVVKCRTRRELAQAPLVVSGIMTGESTSLEPLPLIGGGGEVRFVRSFAWAEINGQVYRTGDTIAGTKIRVERILRHSVQVSLREELRDLGLRR